MGTLAFWIKTRTIHYCVFGKLFQNTGLCLLCAAFVQIRGRGLGALRSYVGLQWGRDLLQLHGQLKQLLRDSAKNLCLHSVCFPKALYKWNLSIFLVFIVCLTGLLWSQFSDMWLTSESIQQIPASYSDQTLGPAFITSHPVFSFPPFSQNTLSTAIHP